MCAGGRRLASLMVLLVAPRVFRAPEAPAAREARRPHFVRRRASKPARALRSLRRPPHQWGLVCWRVAWRIVSKPGQATPPPALRAFGSARRIEARPGPATAHGHRSLARRFLWASWGSRVLSFWGALVRVVTNVVNPRCFLCGFLRCCYKRRQSGGFFADYGGFLAWIDDVCNRGPREAI